MGVKKWRKAATDAAKSGIGGEIDKRRTHAKNKKWTQSVRKSLVLLPEEEGGVPSSV